MSTGTRQTACFRGALCWCEGARQEDRKARAAAAAKEKGSHVVSVRDANPWRSSHGPEKPGSKIPLGHSMKRGVPWCEAGFWQRRKTEGGRTPVAATRARQHAVFTGYDPGTYCQSPIWQWLANGFGNQKSQAA